MTQQSRRAFLKAGLTGIGLSVVTFDQLFGYSELSAQNNGDDVQTILDLAATAEALACTHYYIALTDSKVQLTPAERAILISALDSELYHYEYLTENGGQTLTTQFYMPFNVYNDRANFSTVTQQAETAFISAYLAATRRLAELGNPLLAATTAQIVVTEGVHLALVRQLANLLPNNTSLAAANYYNVSEAVPVLRPFLEGGDGFRGPRAFPGAETIRTLVGANGVQVVEPFTASNE